MSGVLVLLPLIATNLGAIWLWLRAEGRALKAEQDRDALWDACTCDATIVAAAP